MLNLVEAPEGHLAGTITLSSLDSDGKRNKDAVRNVSGSIYQDNISLQIVGRLFEGQANVVGKVDRNDMSLMLGNQASAFRKMSQQEYSAVLAALDKVGQDEQKNVAADKAGKALEADIASLNTDLAAYVKWGSERIEHVSDVRKWYSERILGYQKCLDKITPLAQQGVPRWKWQECAIDVQNDQFNREQQSKGIDDVNEQESSAEKKLHERIAGVPKQIGTVKQLWISACVLKDKAEACNGVADKWSLDQNAKFAHGKPIIDYNTTVPKVRDALAQDEAVKADGDRKLTALSEQISKIFDAAP